VRFVGVVDAEVVAFGVLHSEVVEGVGLGCFVDEGGAGGEEGCGEGADEALDRAIIALDIAANLDLHTGHCDDTPAPW
jgi:hypothetical protein